MRRRKKKAREEEEEHAGGFFWGGGVWVFDPISYLFWVLFLGLWGFEV